MRIGEILSVDIPSKALTDADNELIHYGIKRAAAARFIVTRYLDDVTVAIGRTYTETYQALLKSHADFCNNDARKVVTQTAYDNYEYQSLNANSEA
jgi:hypothetical protein